MANKIYPKWLEALIQASANSALTGTVKAVMVDTGVYIYSDAHQFLSDLSGIIGTAQTLTTKTYVNGVFDADNVTYTAVSGNTVEAVVFYIDTGVAGTSRLVAYIDTGQTGLPVTPNGGNIDIAWNASGIFQP